VIEDGKVTWLGDTGRVTGELVTETSGDYGLAVSEG